VLTGLVAFVPLLVYVVLVMWVDEGQADLQGCAAA
jgi:hypothetical protein